MQIASVKTSHAQPPHISGLMKEKYWFGVRRPLHVCLFSFLALGDCEGKMQVCHVPLLGQHSYSELLAQEVGGTLIGEDRLVVMAGEEWYQTHGFHVFDAIPFTPFQPLL